MPTVDYLPVATGGGANVDSQANFAGAGYQVNGFTSGIALSLQLNKCWRQSSMISAAVANFIANVLGINVLDDGNLAALITNLTNAIIQGAGAKYIAVAFSSPMAFVATANGIVTFETTLTGNVASSTLVGIVAGQIINFIFHQDGVGGRTFAFPPAVQGAGTIDPGASATSTQSFVVEGDLTLRPLGGMTVS